MLLATTPSSDPSTKFNFVLKTLNDIKVTVFLIQVIKYTLHLKPTTCDLFTYDRLNQQTA